MPFFARLSFTQTERQTVTDTQDSEITRITTDPAAYARYLNMQADNLSYSPVAVRIGGVNGQLQIALVIKRRGLHLGVRHNRDNGVIQQRHPGAVAEHGTERPKRGIGQRDRHLCPF